MPSTTTNFAVKNVVPSLILLKRKRSVQLNIHETEDQGFKS